MELTVNLPKKKKADQFDVSVRTGKTFMPPFTKTCKKCKVSTVVYANRPVTKCEHCGGTLAFDTGAVQVGLGKDNKKELHLDGTRTTPKKTSQTDKKSSTENSGKGAVG